MTTMKKLFSIISLALLLGCATTQKPQDVAYKTIGTIATVVDTSMLAWGDFVRAGMAKPNQEVMVKNTYLKYQSVMLSTKVLVLTYVDSPTNQTLLNTSLQAVGNASFEVINTINLFLSKP